MELISIASNERFPVDCRALHEQLEPKTPYRIWFPRQIDGVFAEGEDFCTKMYESTGGRPAEGHDCTIGMAKEIAILQRTDKGREVRRYLIKVEDAWNTPEMVMARAMQMANQTIQGLGDKVMRLAGTIAAQSEQISEMQPKASFYDMILQNKGLLSISEIAKDYGLSARSLNTLLHEKGIQYKQGDIWLPYQKYASKGYMQTKTFAPDADHSHVHMYWTQKGRIFIYETLKTDGILPLIEKNQD